MWYLLLFPPLDIFKFEMLLDFCKNFAPMKFSLFRSPFVLDSEYLIKCAKRQILPIKDKKPKEPTCYNFHPTKSYGCTCEHQSQQELFISSLCLTIPEGTWETEYSLHFLSLHILGLKCKIPLVIQYLISYSNEAFIQSVESREIEIFEIFNQLLHRATCYVTQ